MITLQTDAACVKLSRDLETLSFETAGTLFTAQRPFRFRWFDREIDLARLAEHKLEKISGNCVAIHFSNFVFEARFPGNSYRRPDNPPAFAVTVTVSLEGTELVLKASPVNDLGEGPVSLMLAQDFMTIDSTSDGELILPCSYGMRFDFPRQDYFVKDFSPSSSYNLPMHGYFSAKGGIGMWCDDPDRLIRLNINATSPRQSQVVTELLYDELANDPRELRIVLFPPGSDFRDMARYIRRKLKEAGRLKTLQEKAAEHPEVKQIAGTVFWKHNTYFDARPEGVEKTYSLYTFQPNWNTSEGFPGNWTAEEIFSTASEKGFDRVFVCNTGWNYAGFDAGYPTRLPVNPERGTNDDLKRWADKARSMSPGYIFSCHDNYIDAYAGPEYDPEEMYQPQKGVPQKGAVWRGGLAHFISSTFALKYARRDLPQIAALTGKGGIYLDVTAAAGMFQSRTDGQTLTRKQDLQNRRELFTLATELFGAVAVEGCGTSHFADICTVGAYGELHYVGGLPQTFPYPVPVPLWQMVYHDCIYNFFGEGYAKVHGVEYRLWQALLVLLPASFDEHSYTLSHTLREAYTSTMDDFEILEPLSVGRDTDGSFKTCGVARSSFGDGSVVTVNFNDTAYGNIPPRSYHIEKKQKK
ncbi:MAG: hypothetical protein J6C40_12245 [Lentisphaeria bacterium]|nr:hypothetical protein [Lentisphaeria bacterium]